MFHQGQALTELSKTKFIVISPIANIEVDMRLFLVVLAISVVLMTGVNKLWKVLITVIDWCILKDSLKLKTLNYAYNSDERYIISNITHLKIGKDIFVNMTFIHQKKIVSQKLVFKLFIPKFQNDSRCDNKLFETSIDLCQAGKVIKSNLMVRIFLQNFIDCSLDSFSCPYHDTMRLRNCPITPILTEMPGNVVPLRKVRIELKTIGKAFHEKKIMNFFNSTIIGELTDWDVLSLSALK